MWTDEELDDSGNHAIGPKARFCGSGLGLKKEVNEMTYPVCGIARGEAPDGGLTMVRELFDGHVVHLLSLSFFLRSSFAL
jgi:hypothetical protein